MKNTTSHDIRLERLCKAHLDELAGQLRPADRAEIQTMYSAEPRAALAQCHARSVLAVAWIYQGEVAAVAGVAAPSVLGVTGCVWLWTGPAVERAPKTFFKLSRRMLAFFKTFYPHLYAVCETSYTAAQRYLLHLGAKPGPQVRLKAGRGQVYLF